MSVHAKLERVRRVIGDLSLPNHAVRLRVSEALEGREDEPESRFAQGMRLAAARLRDHSRIAHGQARQLEQKSGFGPEVDAARRKLAESMRREGDEDWERAKELDALRQEV